MAEPRCSAVSRARGEELYATASVVRAWVLVEQPGPWGSEAVTESRLPHAVAGPLQARARALGFRLLLVRRPDDVTTGGHRCFVAYSGRHSRWIEERTVADPDELLSVDFRPLRHGQRFGFGAPRAEPLYLVCTNGRHDPCCAQFGRPVARALHGRDLDSAWECSHIGGDRFAANLVCLPHGVYYGRLTPADALAVVQEHEQGRVRLDHYRGRAGETFAVQAAEYFVRREEGLSGIDDLVPLGHRLAAPDVVEVELAGPNGRRFEARVAVRPEEEPRPLTCAATDVRRPPTYALVGLVAG